jgi:hypothetical protein
MVWLFALGGGTVCMPAALVFRCSDFLGLSLLLVPWANAVGKQKERRIRHTKKHLTRCYALESKTPAIAAPRAQVRRWPAITIQLP